MHGDRPGDRRRVGPLGRQPLSDRPVHSRADWVAMTNGVLADFFPAARRRCLAGAVCGPRLVAVARRAGVQQLRRRGAPRLRCHDQQARGSPGCGGDLLHDRRQRPAARRRRGEPLAALHAAGPITVDIDVAKQIKARIKNGTDVERDHRRHVHAARSCSPCGSPSCTTIRPIIPA